MALWPQRYKRFISPRALEAVEEYVAVAREAGITPAQLAYAFCRSRWFIRMHGSTIVGATSVDQLRENLVAFSVDLPREVLDAIDGIHLRRRNPSLID